MQQLSSRKFFRREEIIGKTAINLGAEKVGEVKDIAYDAEGKMALIVSRGPGSEEAFYSIEQMVAIKDVVLIDESKTVATTQPGRQAAPVNPVTPIAPIGSPVRKLCAKCGKDNPAKNKFCISCGNSF